MLDLDNIDNVVRLAYHVGVAERSDAGICLALARDLGLHNGGLSMSRKSIEALSRWQEIRRELYKLLLHDWAEFSAKAMLTAMMEHAVEQQIIGADSWRLTDDELLSYLTHQVGEGQLIGEIGRRLTVGDLYTPLVLWSSPDINAYRQLSGVDFKRLVERRLSAVLKTRCLFHVILDSGKTERKIKIHVREDEVDREFGRDSKELLIGLFMSRPTAFATARARAEAELRTSLASAGVKGLLQIKDPLGFEEGQRTDQQLGLF
jgi:uncharacterized protein